jgi:hypothetical protein
MGDYNAAVHHIGLKDEPDSDTYGFTLVGQYSKELQREALGGQDFGGSTDLLGPAPASRVTQDDFTGGAYSEDWSKDAAMFSSSRALISEAQSRALVSVPPLALVDAFDASAQVRGAAPQLPVDVLRVGGIIYVLFSNGCYRYNISTETGIWHESEDTLLGIGGLAIIYDYVAIRYEPNEQKLYVLATGNVTNSDPDTVAPVILRFHTDFTAATINAEWNGPTAATGDTAYGFTLSEGGIVLAAANKLFVGAVPLHPNRTAGSIKWTAIDRLPGHWIDSCSYAGRTYILCGDNHKTTSLVAFDGSSIMPIATFPWNFDGTCITEYAGRLYVGGHGTDLNGGPNSGELYEVTGASVRLVRSFAPLAARGSAVVPTSIRTLAVDEGLLWMNCKGLGLIGYDVTSDGLFGGPDYQQGADFDVFALVGGYGRLWAWGHSDASYATEDGLYRIAQADDVVSDYTAELVTSDFVYEVAVKKRLSQLRVLTRYVSATASVSIDGGATWTALSRTGEEIQGYNRVCTFDLSAVNPTEHWRFKIDMDMGTDPDVIGELVAYSCAFAFLDTGKRAWTLTINGADAIEGRDGSTVSQDVALTASTLWGYAEDKTKLTYHDLDGSTANVQLQGFKESQPVIGPNVGTRPEAFYALTLIEV